MTKQAARSIFGAVRDRDTFDSRIPRASSTITAAPCGRPASRHPVGYAAVHRGAVQVGGRGRQTCRGVRELHHGQPLSL